MAAADDRDDDSVRATIAHLHALGRYRLVGFDGGRVAWRGFGGGPPLVLLHGGHGSWLHWVRNVEALAGRFTVWVPDLPGYGDSDEPMEPTLAALVDATLDTLDTLVGRDTPIALAGFSFGGLVAAQLAACRGSVRHLALLGPAGHGGTRRPRGDLRPWRQAWQQGDTDTLAEVMRHNLAVHMLHGDAAIDALALRVHTEACVRTHFHSREISRAGGLADALDRRRGPLLLAWGEHDVTAVPAQVGRTLTTGRQDSQARIVSGAGHWVQYERADDINRLLLDWLGEDRLET
jgi:pimeloyl-ACP methyl ester carboxylesterase